MPPWAFARVAACGVALGACGSATGLLVSSSDPGDAGDAGDAALVSCAYTAEPAPPPCTTYVAVDSRSEPLASCGIDDTTGGPLPPAACRANGCASDTCALLADAGGLGLGDLVVACGCQ